MSLASDVVGDRAAAIDAALEGLQHGEATWGTTSLAGRRALLEQVHALTGTHAQEWVSAALTIKGLDAKSPLAGEEWLSGPYALLNGIAALIETLTALEQAKSPLDGFRVRTTPSGQVAVQVLPHTLFDRLLLNGFTADVWMEPGVSAATARDKAGLGQRDPSATHGVGIVLGAGNITSIPPLDVLYELFAYNRVVALKLNPITDGLLPVFEHIFAPLIDLGVLVVMTGGADVGGYLVNHDAVDHVHMTGSSITHDAIVWGRGEEAARNKAANAPLMTKPITSELGGVSPIIVVPGPWSAADLKYQAEHVVTQRLHNGGYNCIAGQVVVLSASWDQKAEFVDQIRAAMARAPERVAYYPGSDRRVSDACSAYPAAEQIHGRVLVSDSADRSYLLQNEVFGPVLGIIELAGDDFLSTAVKTANEEFAGTLGVNVLVHPKTIKQLGPAFDQAVAALRYGAIAINTWTGLGFLLANASWGAFPGHTLDDVSSGIGVVHNAVLLDSVQRTVIRGPFRPSPRSLINGELAISPKPPWFVTNRTATGTGKALTAFAAAPGWLKLPRIFASALRG